MIIQEFDQFRKAIPKKLSAISPKDEKKGLRQPPQPLSRSSEGKYIQSNLGIKPAIYGAVDKGDDHFTGGADNRTV